jgi:hypothetical protein
MWLLEKLHALLLGYMGSAGLILYGGGKGAAPPAPDYAGAARAQADSSKEVTRDATYANRPTINTPWGSQTWTSGSQIDPSTGQSVTDWTQNINLNPQAQEALNSQQAITAGRSKAAQQLLGQATSATAQPMDWSSLPSVPGSLADAQQGAYSKMAAELQPGRQQQQSALDTRLANQGLPINSEAYNRANSQLSGQWAQQDKGLLAQSLAEGRADVGSQQAMRQNAIAEQAQKRGMSLNELNALLTQQQINLPQGMSAAPNATGGTAQANQALAAATAQGNYGLSAAQQNQSAGTDWGSAIGGIASVAMLASDRRLKSNIRRIGTHRLGIGIYEYDIFGTHQIGVMADEVRDVLPSAVFIHPSGYAMVDYAQL